MREFVIIQNMSNFINDLFVTERIHFDVWSSRCFYHSLHSFSQISLLQQLMQISTQPSPLKATFTQDDIESACLAVIQHLIASSNSRILSEPPPAAAAASSVASPVADASLGVKQKTSSDVTDDDFMVALNDVVQLRNSRSEDRPVRKRKSEKREELSTEG